MASRYGTCFPTCRLLDDCICAGIIGSLSALLVTEIGRPFTALRLDVIAVGDVMLSVPASASTLPALEALGNTRTQHLKKAWLAASGLLIVASMCQVFGIAASTIMIRFSCVRAPFWLRDEDSHYLVLQREHSAYSYACQGGLAGSVLQKIQYQAAFGGRSRFSCPDLQNSWPPGAGDTLWRSPSTVLSLPVIGTDDNLNLLTLQFIPVHPPMIRRGT
jgi:hypothetical protein